MKQNTKIRYSSKLDDLLREIIRCDEQLAGDLWYVEMIDAEVHRYYSAYNDYDDDLEVGFELAMKSVRTKKPVYLVGHSEACLYMLGDEKQVEKKLKAALKQVKAAVKAKTGADDEE
jgi:hypothetical protein